VRHAGNYLSGILCNTINYLLYLQAFAVVQTAPVSGGLCGGAIEVLCEDVLDQVIPAQIQRFPETLLLRNQDRNTQVNRHDQVIICSFELYTVMQDPTGLVSNLSNISYGRYYSSVPLYTSAR